MTKSLQSRNSTSPRGSGSHSAATRITTVGLAVAMTLGLGGAVAARAAEQKRADLQDVTLGDPVAADPASLTAVQSAERARYDAKVAKLRAKYQKHLNELAAEYTAKLGGTASSSSSGGSSNYASSSSGGSSSASNSRGNSSSSSGGSGAAKVTAPKAPATSKGS